MAEQLKGLLIYKNKDAERNQGFISMLMEEALHLDISLKLVFEEDLTYGIINNRLMLTHPKFEVANSRFAIMRTINPLLSKQLEYLGITCFNSSKVSEICNDKALTYQYATRLGIPTLDTYFISYDSFQRESLHVNFPMVLKQVDGRGGNEVYLVNSTKEILVLLKEYRQKRFVLQDFAENPGKDIRVFVMGKEVIGAVLRESQTSFKANYTLGGTVRPYQLNDEEMIMIRKITSTLQSDFIGIDFLLNRNNEFILNELEDVVGCRSLYATSPINAASLYIKYIKKVFKVGG
jgi:gamma-F420-2:alpha-L-glutamate ligase